MAFFATGGTVVVDGVSITYDSSGQIQVNPEFDSDTSVQHEIEIIELQANATLTPIDHDSIISDTYSDTTGYNNTVNAGSTTATFDTNKYKAAPSSTNAHGETLIAIGAAALSRGCKITANKDCVVYEITKHASCTATTVSIFDDSSNFLGKGTFSGSNASLSVALTSGSSYYVMFHSNNSSYTPYGDTSVAGYPYTGTNLDLIDNYFGTVSNDVLTGITLQANRMYNLVNIKSIDTSAKDIVITLPTISGTVEKVQLIGNFPDDETGTIKEFSITDGSGSDTGISFDTLHTLTNLTSNPTSITISLTPSSTPTLGYPSMRTYCLKLFKA